MDATSLRTTYEVGEREPVWLNAADAAKRGIRDGDIVRVYNERGQTLGGAVVTPHVRPGVIVMHEGGWYDPLAPGVSGTLDKHGSVNNLTTDAPDSKLAAGNPSNSVLAEVERYVASRPAVTAFAAAPTVAARELPLPYVLKRP